MFIGVPGHGEIPTSGCGIVDGRLGRSRGRRVAWQGRGVVVLPRRYWRCLAASGGRATGLCAAAGLLCAAARLLSAAATGLGATALAGRCLGAWALGITFGTWMRNVRSGSTPMQLCASSELQNQDFGSESADVLLIPGDHMRPAHSVPRSTRSFDQYSNLLAISRSNPRSRGR